MIGSFSDMIESFSNEVTDFTNDGTCCQCGECCGRLLTLTDTEIKQIKRYVRRNNIKPNKHAVVASVMFDMKCPFMSGNKDIEKCAIYDIRPLVCKAFKCDRKTDNPDAEKELFLQSIRIIDMWEEFFPGVEVSIADEVWDAKI